MVEVSFSNDGNCKIEFLLNENKVKGVAETQCLDVTCPSGINSPINVKIRQTSTNDGWRIEKMEIQKFPGSSDFITYSLDGTLTQFWVDGNDDNDYGSTPACTDSEWCDLMRVDPDGNPLHIILKP